jgi:hypothetical protein
MRRIWGIALEAVDLIVKLGEHDGFCEWFRYPNRGDEMNLFRLKRFSKTIHSWTLGIEFVSLALVVYGLWLEVSGSNEAYRISAKQSAELTAKAEALGHETESLPQIEKILGVRFQTVRGVFQEGTPAYLGSGILKKSHIQVVVRDSEVILGYFLPET